MDRNTVHVFNGATERVRALITIANGLFAQSEVRKLYMPGLTQHDILGFEVPGEWESGLSITVAMIIKRVHMHDVFPYQGMH